MSEWSRHDTRVIVNPRAANGRVQAAWPRLRDALQEALGPFEAVWTGAPMHAAELAGEAAARGYARVVAVGGDGTLSEVVAGLFPNGEPLAPALVLGHVSLGTGGDFRRSLALPKGPDAAIARLRGGRARPVDVGVLDYTTHEGRPATRAFLNLASFGLSGRVDQLVNRARFSKRLGGSFAFAWASLVALAGHRNAPVRITVDDTVLTEGPIALACVCNGQYAGGGMRFAPHARLDDGRFDVIVVGDAGRAELVASFGSIYRGRHLEHPRVSAATGARIVATPLGPDPVLLDVDGEAPGRLPATFRLLPGAVRLLGA